MKAIVCHGYYGARDAVKLEDVEKPVPAANEVLIRVRAAALNALDWHLLRGTPLLLRAMSGLRRPKYMRPGVDVAGEVEAVGAEVTDFKPGDAVFGGCRGALSEYVCTAATSVVPKPDNVTFEEAAAVPVAALTALQGLDGYVQANRKVLVNGAAGGVGTFAVQLAKAYGGDVTGVCSTRNLELVRSIGADRVIDYTREDFTANGARYDVIFDAVGNHPLKESLRVLAPGGKFLGVGVRVAGMLGPLLYIVRMFVWSRFVNPNVRIVSAKRNKADLTLLRDLLESGKITPVIDRMYRLEEAAEAIGYLGTEHARGKIVVKVMP